MTANLCLTISSRTRSYTDVAVQFFVAFRERLKTRFNQLEIWIVSYPVDRF